MWFFGTNKKSESAAFIRVCEDSVGGALAHFEEGSLPQMLYATRVPIEKREGESIAQSLTRTLDALGVLLIKEGMPELARVAKSGKLTDVLISIDAPWQQTSIKQDKIERTKPFTFTKSLLDAALEKSAEGLTEQLLGDETIIGTVLDGYETKKPIGKHVSRASILILSSFIDKTIAEAVSASVRKTFHRHNVNVVAASSIRFQAVRVLFPHEEDYLLLDGSPSGLVTALVRRNLLVSIEHQTFLQSTDDPRLPALLQSLERITARYPLPRSIFFIAPDETRDSFKALLEGPALQKLLLTTEAPRVVPITSNQLTAEVALGARALPDVALMCMVTFWKSNHP